MLFRRELRLNLKGFLVCTAICVALSMYMIALLPSVGSDLQAMIDLKFPKQLQLAFGMSNLDFHKPMSGYSILFSYFYLTFGIYAAGLFSRIVSKEFADKTAEYLFALPARRMDLILTKLYVALGYLTASIVITFLISLVCFGAFIEADWDLIPLLLMFVASWIGALFFGALSYLLSAYYVKSRIAVGIVLGAYLLQVVISLKEQASFLKYLSPFDWFKGSDIANQASLSLPMTLIAVVATVACLVWGTRQYLNKDVLV